MLNLGQSLLPRVLDICWSRVLGLSLREWYLIGVYLMGLMLLLFALQICERLIFWTDGSLVLDEVSGVSSSGSGFFSHLPSQRWRSRRWGHLDVLCHVGGVESYRGFCSVPGPLQTVQRTEFWGVILTL